MSLKNAKLAGTSQKLTPTQQARGEFATGTYVLNGRALHALGICPSAWRRKGCEEDQHVSALQEAVWSLLVHKDRTEVIMAVRPEFTQRTMLVCPKCGSTTSTAKRCTTCDVERDSVMTEVRWTRQRAECRAWEERAQAIGRILISPADMDRAKGAVSALLEHTDVTDVLTRASLGVIVTGHVVTPSGKAVRVHEMILALPVEGDPDDDSIYMLETLVRTGPGAGEVAMDWKGDATRGALALDLVNHATDGVRKKVRFLVAGIGIDNEPGFCELSQAAIQAGRQNYEAGAANYVTGAHDGCWPGHDHDGRGKVAWRVVDAS